jgi:hypothetical protein
MPEFRYLVFAGANYYPSGGWNDYKESFTELHDAVAHAECKIGARGDWSHVVDLETMEVVHRAG